MCHAWAHDQLKDGIDRFQQEKQKHCMEVLRLCEARRRKNQRKNSNLPFMWAGDPMLWEYDELVCTFSEPSQGSVSPAEKVPVFAQYIDILQYLSTNISIL